MPLPNEAPSVSPSRVARRRAREAAARTTARWQSGAAADRLAGRRRRSWLRRWFGVGLRGLLFLLSAAALVYYLILLPAKTPLVAGVALDYRWPLPPNAWTREDLDGLADTLGGETLRITEVPLQGPSSLDEFSRKLAAASRSVPRGGAVLVYLSAHAAVDGAGQPCLLLPDADPLDSATWLRLNDLFAQLKSLEEQHACLHLLILDAHRQRANWSIGLLDDGFTAGLADAVRQAAAPGLVVLNSVAHGQLDCTSPLLPGSAFGHWLRYGLAGEADADGNGQIACRELADYLQQRVDGWARTYRGVRQTPQLYPAQAPDFPLAWTLNPRALKRLRRGSDPAPSASDLPLAEKLARLWEKHDELAALRPGHLAPHRWQQWEHELLWLDQAALAGQAYRATVQQMSQRLDGELSALLELIRGPTGPEASSPIRLTALLAADASLVNSELAVWSPALAGYLGLPAADPRASADSLLSQLGTRYGVDERWADAQLKQQVLALHELAARLSVPSASPGAAADARAHRLIRPLLDPCDQTRRTLEDRLIAGGISATELARQVSEAQRRYRQLENWQAVLARSYQSRDQAWAALPYLAAWSCVQRGPDSRAAAGAQPPAEPPQLAAEERIRELAALTQQLDQALRQLEQSRDSLQDPQDALANIETLAAKTAEPLAALQAALDDEARRLALPGPATGQLLREIAGLLATPLVPAKLRAPLYPRYLAATRDVDAPTRGDAASPAAGEATGASAPDESSSPAEDSLRIPAQGGYPPLRLAACLVPGEDGRWMAGGKTDAAALGEALRQALRQAAQGAADSPPAGADQQARRDAAPGTPGTAADLELAAQDRRLRRLVALAGTASTDPFQPLRRRALQELLLWHGHRALDDFWGTLDADGAPHFAAAARAYLEDVPRLGRLEAGIAGQARKLGELLERRTQAARLGLQAMSTDLLLIDDQSEMNAQVGVRATPQTPDLPPGCAAVFLRDSQGPLPGTIGGLELQPDQEPADDGVRRVTIPLTARDLAGRGPGLQAVVALRGHEFTTPLTLRQLHGPRIETVRHRYGPSRITLAGAERKTAAIVFILDCSQSMREAVDLEAPDVAGTPSRSTKLKVAVDALRGLLERFGERGDARIGVRFFGHRVGWRTDQPGTLARREDYPEPIPPTLRPYADVELSLPLGRFDSIVAGDVVRRLDALRPWGETPVYLALRQALQDFGPPDAQADRRVVVITDGVNNQLNPPPEFAPSRTEIEAAYAGQGVRIEILGFAIPSEEQAAASREFGQLADATGGSFSVATNASSLIRDLQRQLVKTSFRVLQGQTVLAQADVGGTVRLDPVPECVIEVDQIRDPARLAGGEHLRLGLSRDGRRIIAWPYEEGYPLFAPLIAAATATETNYRLGLHRPVRSGETVTFPLSFQTVDGAIPVRPGDVWVEIAPLVRDRSATAPSYVFWDANYEPDLPVPVLLCRCPDWPAAASQAELRVWCLPEASEDAEVVPLSAVADRLPPSENGFSVKRLDGVGYQVRQTEPRTAADPLRIRVVQRHEAGTPIQALKLDLAPPARRCVRRFDAEQGVVVHDFEYDPGAAPAAEAVSLRWQTRDQLTASAWRLDRPVRLGVSKQDEVVVPPQILDPRAPAGR